jgi:hypothetical protein
MNQYVFVYTKTYFFKFVTGVWGLRVVSLFQKHHAHFQNIVNKRKVHEYMPNKFDCIMATPHLSASFTSENIEQILSDFDVWVRSKTSRSNLIF